KNHPYALELFNIAGVELQKVEFDESVLQVNNWNGEKMHTLVKEAAVEVNIEPEKAEQLYQNISEKLN
ncbi:ComE operon protein 2, partial [Listeria monocytogenes]|nr:ComE operon protein 2 [Listeria monocytogenes]